MISYKIITEDVDIKNAVENERKVRHSKPTSEQIE